MSVNRHIHRGWQCDNCGKLIRSFEGGGEWNGCVGATSRNQSTTIKRNTGDQNYTLPREVDLSKYEAVSIWCKQFRVNFGAARLRTYHTVSQR